MEILERENGVETLIDNQDQYKVYEGLIHGCVTLKHSQPMRKRQH